MSEHNLQESVSEHPPLSEKTSLLLTTLTSGVATPYFKFGFVIEQFKSRSFGGILLICSLMALLPIVSFIAGLVVLVVGLQMLFGIRIPVLPQVILNQRINKQSFEAFVNQAVPWLEKLEQYIRPRWFFYTTGLGQRLLGFLIILLSLVSLMPLPFSNVPPSIALTLLSLGILERDGILTTIGVLVSMLALAVGYFILLVVIQSVKLMFQ